MKDSRFSDTIKNRLFKNVRCLKDSNTDSRWLKILSKDEILFIDSRGKTLNVLNYFFF